MKYTCTFRKTNTHTQTRTHACIHTHLDGARCSEVVFYEDHVGHLEPINTVPEEQTLDQCSSPHTITFIMGRNTKSDLSPAPCQHLSKLGHACSHARGSAGFTCATFLQKAEKEVARFLNVWHSSGITWMHLLNPWYSSDYWNTQLYKHICLCLSIAFSCQSTAMVYSAIQMQRTGELFNCCNYV